MLAEKVAGLDRQLADWTFQLAMDFLQEVRRRQGVEVVELAKLHFHMHARQSLSTALPIV